MDEQWNVDDMISLPVLSEQSILTNLKARYTQQQIYTYTGNILVALNPYASLSIYDPNYIQLYHKKSATLPPHIYAIAEATFTNIRQEHRNQAVIISGESGAGKSESTKLILQYLTAITCENDSWIEQQILEASTVLESLGNAKTVRNHNSSRFGKFVQIHFDARGQIVGAGIVNYLLEKSRLAVQSVNERNFHIFYELCLGASQQERELYQLLNHPSEYHYLNQSGCIEMPDIHDKQQLAQLKMALTVLKFSLDEVQSLFTIISAILLLGNVNFKTDSSDTIQIANSEILDIVCALLQCSVNQFVQVLTVRRLFIRNEYTFVPLRSEQANDNRDSIAKALYNALFHHVIERINQSTATQGQSVNFIGVLDIFGFEHFKTNSFEQLCINYTNEKLQNFFTQYIFKLEQEEYEREGIAWQKIQYKDNSLCLELIESKMGLLALLDEECRFPKGTDDSLVNKYHDTFQSHEHYIKPRTSKGQFGVRHYAGDVIYDVKSFLDKNRDAVAEEVLDLFSASDLGLLRAMFPQAQGTNTPSHNTGTMTPNTLTHLLQNKLNKAATTSVPDSPRMTDSPATLKAGTPSGATKKSTAAHNFKNQLFSLVTTLSETTPHYVRCIKPNPTKSSFILDPELTLAQLRYSGMLDTIKIRKSGFAFRFPFASFIDKFFILAQGMNGSDVEKCQWILSQLPADREAALGKTKVFLRPETFDTLTQLSHERLKSYVICIQRHYRGFVARRSFLEKQLAALILHTVARGFLARRARHRHLKAIQTLQRTIRGYLCRKSMQSWLRQRRKELGMSEPIKETVESKKEREALQEMTRETQEKLAQIVALIGVVPEVEEITFSLSEKSKKQETEDLDEMFAFLNDFENEETETPTEKKTDKVTEKLSEELDSIFASLDIKLPETVPVAAPPPTVSSKPAALTAPPKIPPKSASVRSALNTLESGNTVPSQPPIPLPQGNLNSNATISPQRPPKPSHLKAVTDTGSLSSLNSLNVSLEKIGLGSNTALDKTENSDTAVYPLLQYAEKYLLLQDLESSGLLFKKKEKPTFEAMLSFGKHALTQPLHTFNETWTDDDKNSAIEASKCLLKIMESWHYSSLERFVEIGMNGKTGVRDELYVQLMRQLTTSQSVPKQWDQWLANGWRCMLLVCSSFPPSKQLIKYVHTFLMQQKPNSSIDFFIQESQKALKSIVLTCLRDSLPLQAECDALAQNRYLQIRVKSLDQQSKILSLPSYANARHVLKDWTQRMHLQEGSGWSLYEKRKNNIRYIKGETCLLDILSEWEKDEVLLVDEPFRAGDHLEAEFLVKKRVFAANADGTQIDPVEYALLVSQAHDDVLNERYPINEKMALQLAALYAQIIGIVAGEKINLSKKYTPLSQFLPKSIIPHQTEDAWCQGLYAQHQKLSEKSAMQCRVLYLETVKQMKLFGKWMIPVTHQGFWSLPQQVLLALGSDQILLLNCKTRAILASYPSTEVTWSLEDENIYTLYIRNETNFPLKCDDEKLEDEFTSLLCEYLKDHGKGNKESKQDKSNAVNSIENCRQVLIQSALLRDQGPASFSGTGTSSTLKKWMKKSVTTTAMSYTKEDWMFSKVKLVHSLIRTDQVQLDDLAIEMNLIILIICGLAPLTLHPLTRGLAVGNDPIASLSGALQHLIHFTMKHVPLWDELYLQLLKQLTPPETLPSHWDIIVKHITALLSVVSGCLLPSSGPVLDYLKCVVKQTLDKSTSQFILTRLNQAMKKKRNYPPSKMEIQSSAATRSLMHRFCFCDGQFRALMFDPFTTMESLFGQLMEKLKVEEKETFALFWKSPKKFIRLQPTILMSDVLFQIEKEELTNNDSNNTISYHCILLMKRLILSHQASSQPTEEALILHQTLSLLSLGFHRLTREQLVQLAAYRLQADRGDQNFSKLKTYDSLVPNVIPAYWLDESSPVSSWAKELEWKHGQCKGMSTMTANEKTLALLREWQWFGATFYAVEQTWDNQLQRELYCAIHYSGIHLFSRNPKETQPLLSWSYKEIVRVKPNDQTLLWTGLQQQKVVLNTLEAVQMAYLIKDYMDVSIKSA